MEQDEFLEKHILPYKDPEREWLTLKRTEIEKGEKKKKIHSK